MKKKESPKCNYKSCEFSCIFLSCFKNVGKNYRSNHQDKPFMLILEK